MKVEIEQIPYKSCILDKACLLHIATVTYLIFVHHQNFKAIFPLFSQSELSCFPEQKHFISRKVSILYVSFTEHADVGVTL